MEGRLATSFSLIQELKHLKEQNQKLHVVQRQSGKAVASSDGDSQIHNLEAKFDEAYAQSLAVKDERISQLEQRVEETTHENQSLRNDVSSLRKELIQSQARRLSPGHSPMSRYSIYVCTTYTCTCTSRQTKLYTCMCTFFFTCAHFSHGKFEVHVDVQ